MATRRSRSSTTSPSSTLVSALKQLAATDDGKYFAKDVCEEFPLIAADYQAICPNRMDLGTMCKKAAAGSYQHNLADALIDIQLIVDNCILYNGQDSEYGQRALRLGDAATLVVRTIIADAAAAAAGVETAGAQTQQMELDHNGPPPSQPPPPPPASNANGTEHKEVRRMRLSTGTRTDGKRDRDGGSSDVAAPPPPAVRYTSRQLVDLVKSFERKEDEGIFAHDPVQMFPQIAVDYDKICPQRMDLAKMQSKARKGEYNDEPGLDSLVADVRLIAANCQRYNGAESPLGIRAQSFLDVALMHVQAFLAHPSTWTPSAAAAAPPPTILSQVVSRTTASHTKKPSTTLNHHHSSSTESFDMPANSAALLGSVPASGGAAPAVSLDPPSIRPLSFQLPLHVPAMLREYMLTESLRRNQSRWTALPLESAETVAATVRRFCACLDLEAAQLRQEGDRTTEQLRCKRGECDEAALSAQTNIKVETPTDSAADVPVATDGDNESNKEGAPPSRATIHHASMCIVTARTRERYAFHAQTTLATLMDVFEDLLPVSLLTPSERCDVDAFLAKYPRDAAVASSTAEGPSSTKKGEEAKSYRGGSVCEISLLDGQKRFWSSRTHIRYFIRLLLQVPELGTLTITRSTLPTSSFATAFASATTLAAKISILKQLKVPDHVLTRMHQIIPVVEDFLCFIDSSRCCASSARE